MAVIGTGWWSTQHHLPQLLSDPRVTVTALADADEERVSRAGAMAPSARLYSSAEDLFAHESADAVVIATAHASHAALAEMALLRGAAVLVEKPLALSLSQARRVRAAAERSRRPVVVGCTYQFTESALGQVVRANRHDLFRAPFIAGQLRLFENKPRER